MLPVCFSLPLCPMSSIFFLKKLSSIIIVICAVYVWKMPNTLQALQEINKTNQGLWVTNLNQKNIGWVRWVSIYLYRVVYISEKIYI